MAGKNARALTKNDELLLSSYSSILDAFAEYFGSGYEFVLHRLDNLENSVIKIVNGHHTGRAKGAPITDLALNMLSKIEDASFSKDYICYQGQTKTGDPLHSSTILIRGESGKPIALICINFYLNTPMHQFMNEIFCRKNDAEIISLTETFSTDIEGTIKEAILKASNFVDNSSEIGSASQRNKLIIKQLYKDGIFKLKGAVPTVSKILGIAKNTVYLHLKSVD